MLPPTPVQRPRASAVLLPVFASKGETHLLFIKRSDRVAWHKGEIAFPGGRVEDSDASPLEAALRETEEELGIPRRDVVPLGALEPVATVVSGMLIYPHVGRLTAPPIVRPDGYEVAEVIAVPLWHLLDPASRLIGDRVVSGGTRRLPFYKYGEHEIWGATGRILESLIARLGDPGKKTQRTRWTLDQIEAMLARGTPGR